MTSPSPLPISDPQAATATTTVTASATTTFSGDHSILTSIKGLSGRVSTSVRRTLSNSRPWTELIDRNAFSRPESLSDATTRIRKNGSYFRINYLALLALVLAFSLISHPLSLLTLVSLLAAWLCLYAFRPSDQPLIVLGRSFSDRETLGILILATVVVVFLTSVGSLLMSAVLIGSGIVCAHGAFRDPEDLFMDEQDSLGSGFFSLLGGAAASSAANAAVAVGPSIMSRV